MDEALLLAPLDAKKPSWQLRFDGGTATFREVDGPGEHRLRRDDTPEQLDIVSLSKFAVLTVRVAGQKLQLKLTPEQHAAVEAWLGPPTMSHMRVALRQAYSLMLVVAAVLVVTSLPLPGDAEAGVADLPLDVVGLGLGGAAFAMWAHARFRPRPYLFLLDIAWFCVVMGDNVRTVVMGRSSPWWLLPMLLLPLVLRQRWAQYRRFRHLPGASS